MTPARLFLASQSPRRKALLESVGIKPIVIAPAPNDDAEAIEKPLPGEMPLPYVKRVANIKRELACKRLQGVDLNPSPQAHDLILAADTTVALDDQIMGKPIDQRNAIQMLRRLSGKTHQVHTAISIGLADASRSETAIVSAKVRFAPLSDAWINAYVASGEPMDKAGAYGIQGPAGAMIPEISGSYTAIVGLPLYETLDLMRSFCADLQGLIR